MAQTLADGRIIPTFHTQADWTEGNIEIIREAIISRIITDEYQLRRFIGNQSKKLGPDGIKTVGSTILELKLDGRSKIEANEKEHAFYDEYTTHLRTVRREHARYINFDPENDQQRDYLESANESLFTREIYDYMMGEILYNKAKERYPHISDEALIRQIETIKLLRNQESELFVLLQGAHGDDGGHEHAEIREGNNIAQLLTYFRWRHRQQELIDDAGHYKKYLKYKQKYIALKKLLKNKLR